MTTDRRKNVDRSSSNIYTRVIFHRTIAPCPTNHAPVPPTPRTRPHYVYARRNRPSTCFRLRSQRSPIGLYRTRNSPVPKEVIVISTRAILLTTGSIRRRSSSIFFLRPEGHRHDLFAVTPVPPSRHRRPTRHKSRSVTRYIR